MAIYPGATKRLIPKWNVVRITRYRRVNLHVAVWERDSIHDLFAGSNSACSHFYVNKAGGVEQLIDTKYRSAADRDGNDSTISVETEGGTHNADGEEWTPQQIAALAKLWAWARDTHGITNQIAINTNTNANSEGLSWHRLGIKGNFAGRPGLASKSYGGILYSSAAGKVCPGDAKINQIPEIFAIANGDKKAPVVVKPGAAVVKPKAPKKSDKSGSWPEKPLKVTDKHTVQSDAAWRELLAAIGYRDKDLGKNLQSWLDDLEDPRTGTGYYPMPPLLHDGVMGEYGVKALQRKLYDTEGDDGKRLYNGKADGKRESMTVRAEIGYLNLKSNRGK